MGDVADARAVALAAESSGVLGFDRVYTESVRYPVWQRGHERAVFSLSPAAAPDGAGAQRWHRRADEAEVVEFATLKALENAPDGSLEGKIAYVGNRMSAAAAARATALLGARGGASTAARKGAVANPLRSVGTDSDRLPHTGTMRYEEGVRQIAAAALSRPHAHLLLSNMLRRGQPSWRWTSTRACRANTNQPT